jgi:hypothetical protein
LSLKKGSEFKKNFVLIFNDFSIKPTATTIKNPQSNVMAEYVHQVSDHDMIKSHQLKDPVLDYIDPFGEFLASIA